jgi:hypothetical protein
MRRRYRSLPLRPVGPQADPQAGGARSEEACPACGEHSLSLIGFPYVSTMGVQPYTDILGMGEPQADQPPGIGCLACGVEWPDLDSFREAQSGSASG